MKFYREKLRRMCIRPESIDDGEAYDGLLFKSPVTIYTYMNVREDDISLFGFDDEEGLNLFKNLIIVNRIPQLIDTVPSYITTDKAKHFTASHPTGRILSRQASGLPTIWRKMPLSSAVRRRSQRFMPTVILQDYRQH